MLEEKIVPLAIIKIFATLRVLRYFVIIQKEIFSDKEPW